jgi:hypothetical protein
MLELFYGQLPLSPLTSRIVPVCAPALQTKLDNGHSLLSQVQYLSSTSGGSWFNAAFSYKVLIWGHLLV